MVVPIPHFTECRRNRCFFFLSHYFLSLSLSLSLSLLLHRVTEESPMLRLGKVNGTVRIHRLDPSTHPLLPRCTMRRLQRTHPRVQVRCCHQVSFALFFLVMGLSSILSPLFVRYSLYQLKKSPSNLGFLNWGSLALIFRAPFRRGSGRRGVEMEGFWAVSACVFPSPPDLRRDPGCSTLSLTRHSITQITHSQLSDEPSGRCPSSGGATSSTCFPNELIFPATAGGRSGGGDGGRRRTGKKTQTHWVKKGTTQPTTRTNERNKRKERQGGRETAGEKT